MKRICILMGTYNGEKFLKEQLLSIQNQDHHNWILYISDDGSQDNTIEILKAFQKKMTVDRVRIFDGPRKGFSANFLSLVCRDEIESDFIAFCDQDDIWESNHLSRALRSIENIKGPALYGARTTLVDENNRVIGHSTLWKKRPCFGNALVQSIASGNTMLFNQAAAVILKKYSKNITVASHDLWAYQVVSGVGGVVYYDAETTVRYRQHEKNIYGRNDTLQAKWSRVKRLFQGEFRQINQQSIEALLALEDQLTLENRTIFLNFKKQREGRLIQRIVQLCHRNCWRQTLMGNIGLIASTFLRKI